MRNLPVLPGYQQTKRARLKLVIDIEVVLENLLSKADKTLLGILKEFGRFLVRVVAPDMPKQLLR